MIEKIVCAISFVIKKFLNLNKIKLLYNKNTIKI